jgi:16S rRNA (uracil1498-N3)-methyltransferase
MPQFFLSRKSLQGNSFLLDGPEAYHIIKVLRCREGEELEFFDGLGGKYKGKITKLHSDGGVEGDIIATLDKPHGSPKVQLELYPALLKASRWEWLLEKGTEIGVHSFQPVVTQRTIVLLHEAERVQSKGDRWNRIVMSAAKQCGRAELPAVGSPIPLREALVQSEAKKSLLLFGWEGMTGSPASSVLKEAISKERARNRRPLTVSLFIGPEGGFTAEEIELAQSHNAVCFGMGTTTLRGETAAITASSLVLYELGTM